MLGQRRGNRGRKGTNPRHRLNALRLWPTSGCSSREGSIEKAIRYDTHVKPQLSPPAPPPLRRPMATSARRINITPPTTHQRVEPVTEEPANRAVAARGGVAPRAPAPGPVRDRPMRPWLGPPSPGRGRHRRCRPQGRAAAPAQPAPLTPKSQIRQSLSAERCVVPGHRGRSVHELHRLLDGRLVTRNAARGRLARLGGASAT
jgi:hypothetical protein